MKTWKKIIAVLMIVIVFTSTTAICEKRAEAGVITTAITIASTVVTAYALVQIHERAYQEYHSGAWHDIHEWASKNLGIVGHMMTMNTEAEFFDNIVKPVLVRHGILSEQDTMDETSYDKWKSYVDNHYELNNDGTITYDNSMKAIFNDFINQDKSNNVIYNGFTLDISRYNLPQAVNDYIEANQDDYIINLDTTYGISNVYTISLSLYPIDTTALLYTNEGSNYFTCTPYSNTTFQQSNDRTLHSWLSNGNSSSSHVGGQYVKTNQRIMKNNYPYIKTEYNPIYYNPSYATSGGTLVSSRKQIQYTLFGSTNFMMEYYQRGTLPYYTDNSVYNDWSQSTGDYTLTTNNSNLTTYGDITNYIDSFNTENGSYPSPNDINVFINTNNEDTRQEINNQGGQGGEGGQGGSGGTASATANNEGINITNNNNPVINFILGGETVSGNGSGTVSGNSAGGSGLNFGFLGTLGQTLKSLIENIGTAIVDIITGISSVIAEVVTNIPTVFVDFVGAVLGWLPPELQALISMAVVAMITFGLIKLIRG